VELRGQGKFSHMLFMILEPISRLQAVTYCDIITEARLYNRLNNRLRRVNGVLGDLAHRKLRRLTHPLHSYKVFITRHKGRWQVFNSSHENSLGCLRSTLLQHAASELHLLCVLRICEWIKAISFVCSGISFIGDASTPCPQKRNHSIFASNFAKCWPIFKILSPTDLAVNFL